MAEHVLTIPHPVRQPQELVRPAIRRKASSPTAPPLPATAESKVERVLASSGRSLDRSARDFMEPRFGFGFGHVRVHTGPEAADSARAVRARAYTVGRHVVFNTGEYAPETPRGRKLLAHELTHVVQQDRTEASLQRQELDDGLPGPIVVPILTSSEVVLPCPPSVNEIVPEFIRESREHAKSDLAKAWIDEPSQAQLAEKAWLFLGKWRQTYPAEDPRNPTDGELAIACAEHHNYARYMVASGEWSAGFARAAIDGYTLIKDQLSHAGIEWLLSADGNTPTKPTRCQNDWGHQGVNEGLRDWAVDHPGE